MKHAMKLHIMSALALLLGACAQPGTGVYRTDIKDDTTARIVTGQSDAEVTALIGTPYRRVRFDNLKASGVFKNKLPPFDANNPVWHYDITALREDEKRLFVEFRLQELF